MTAVPGSRSGRVVLFGCIVVALVAIAGCRGSDPAEARRSLRSSAATAALVGEAWLAGRVPDAYARQVMRVTEHEVEKLLTRFGRTAPAPGPSTRVAIAELRRGIEAHDAQQATRGLEATNAAWERLSAIAPRQP